MKNNPIHDMDVTFSVTRALAQKSAGINQEGLLASERIDEIMMMCDRQQPVYEQISSFSVALYTLGFFDCPDLMSFEDVDAHEAAAILREHFTEIRSAALPADYRITESGERYLLVVGDPLLPVHFAALVDARSDRPFFSKLPFFGSGFDSLKELTEAFSPTDGVSPDDFHYFKRVWHGRIPPEAVGKIFIV
ncbi:MAG: hypothetical protein AB1724_04035 [Thermodesulfobacteriota bacterium]